MKSVKHIIYTIASGGPSLSFFFLLLFGAILPVISFPLSKKENKESKESREFHYPVYS